VVLVGLGGDANLHVNMVVAKELSIVGTFRFSQEFAEAARLISSRAIDLSPMLSATYPAERANEAFIHASDKSRATKIALTF
jgi:L-idonate 5-dehydrogenase